MKSINFKYLNTLATCPTRGSKYAAGYDLYAAIAETQEIKPHTCVKIDTGLAIELPENTFGGIFARSGLATKEGLRPANCVAVIDQDYRGSILVPIYNDSDEIRKIQPGERIAQLIVLPFVPVEWNEVEELSDTQRGEGGFGSTGIQ